MDKKKYILIITFFLIILSVLTFEKNQSINVLSKSTIHESKEVTVSSNDNANKEDNIDEYIGQTIKITSMGNLVFHGPILESAKTSEGYDFTSSFQYIKDKINGSDISIAVLESSLPGDGEYSGYPIFKSPDEVLDGLKYAGVNTINFANNHVIDSGSSGVYRDCTISKEKGFDVLGIRKNTSDKKYLVKEVKGHKIGLISYVYETEEVNGEPTINGICVPKECMDLINRFNYKKLEELYDDVEQVISEMKREGVEFFIFNFHWGEEYDTMYNSYQKEIAEKLNDLGVDIILGNHPHVIQPYEVIKNEKGKSTFVCYGQGNNLSNQSYATLGNSNTEDGLLLSFLIEIEEEGLVLKEYTVTPLWVERTLNENGKYNFTIIPLGEDDDITASNESVGRTKRIVGQDSLGTFEIN